MSKLQLPTSVGLSDLEKQSLKLRWNTIDAVEEKLEIMGFSPDLQPVYSRPTITAEQLTTTINQDYTVLYAQHLAWYNYTTPVLARTKARLLGYQNELTNIETRIRKDLRKKNRELARDDKLNEKDIETEIWSDPDFLEVKREEQRYAQNKMEIEAYLDVMNNNLKVISRQIEIRKIEMGGVHQENNMPGRYRGPRTP